MVTCWSNPVHVGGQFLAQTHKQRKGNKSKRKPRKKAPRGFAEPDTPPVSVYPFDIGGPTSSCQVVATQSMERAVTKNESSGWEKKEVL